MKKILFLLLSLSLGGCYAVDAASRGLVVADAIGFNVDTNGYQSKRKTTQRVCEYRIDELHTEWKPC